MKTFKVMSVAGNDSIHVCVLMQRVYTQIAGNLTVFYVGISVHGGRLRYDGIGQIQKWCNFLKMENLRFKLDVNLLVSLKNF